MGKHIKQPHIGMSEEEVRAWWGCFIIVGCPIMPLSYSTSNTVVYLSAAAIVPSATC